MAAPDPGWTTKATVKEVYDGDTIVVTVSREMRIRLLDCWAPEVRTKNKAEKKKGFASRDRLRATLPIGSEITLQIPTHVEEDGTVQIQDVLTMGRFLGRVWSEQGIDVSADQVSKGVATKDKS